MPQNYNLKQYSEAGNPWSMPGRGEFQTFFIDLDGVEGTVLTNKKKGNTPKLGQVYGDLIDEGKIGKKGQKIYKFKQAQLPDGEAPASEDAWGTPKTAPSVQANHSPSHIPEWFAPYAVMIKDIHSAMGNHTTTQTIEEAPKQEEPFESPVVEDKEPSTKLSQAELEDIFGGKMEPIEIEE